MGEAIASLILSAMTFVTVAMQSNHVVVFAVVVVVDVAVVVFVDVIVAVAVPSGDLRRQCENIASVCSQ